MNSTPKQIGPFEIREECGNGGMSTVYRAYDTVHQREVALKVLLTHHTRDQLLLRRFEQEGENMQRLVHPNIVRIYGAGQVDDTYYIAMEYIGGGTLADLLKKRPGPLPLAETASIIEQIAAALDYAHKLGFLHRDIKPSNILLGEQGRVLLSDFGVARLLSAPEQTMMTTTGFTVGTPNYMSPEQALGEQIDQRTDVYSLGVVAYAMLTGKLPFEADSHLVLLRKIVDDPLPAPAALNPTLPVGVSYALQRVLAKDPNRRYPTTGAFAAELNRHALWTPAPSSASADATIAMRPLRNRTAASVRAEPLTHWTPETAPQAPPPQVSSPRRQHRISAFVISLLLVIIALLIVLLLRTPGGLIAPPLLTNLQNGHPQDQQPAVASTNTPTASATPLSVAAHAPMTATNTPMLLQGAILSTTRVVSQVAVTVNLAASTALTSTATAPPSPTPPAADTATVAPTATDTAIASATPTSTPPATATTTVPPTATPSATPTATLSPTPLPSATPTASATATPAPTNSPTATWTPLPTPTASATATPQPTSTPLPTLTSTATPNLTATEQVMQTAVQATVAAVLTANAPTATPSPTNTATPSPTSAETAIQATVAAILTAKAQSAPPSPTAAPTPTPLPPTATPAPVLKLTVAAPTATPAPVAPQQPAAAQPANQAGLITGFEKFGIWKRGQEAWGTFTQSKEQVVSGAFAGKLAYNFPANVPENRNYVVFQQTLPIPGQPDALQMQVYGDGSNSFLNVWVQDSAGQRFQFTFGQISHTGWAVMTAPLDLSRGWPNQALDGDPNAVLKPPLRLLALVLDGTPEDVAHEGVIYLDDLSAGAANDVAPAKPVVAPTVSGGQGSKSGAAPTKVAPTATTAASAQQPAAPVTGLTGHIAYTILGNNGKFNTVLYNVATGERGAVLANKRQPSYSYGSYLLVNGEGGGNDNILRMSADGGNVRPISAHPEDAYPVWSPSSESIAFDSTFQGDGRHRLYFQKNAKAQGEAPPLYYKGREIFGRYPVYLDNWRIAYVGCDFWAGGSSCGIYSTDGKDADQPVRATDQTGDIPSDNWGDQILFSSNRNGSWDVYAVNWDGGNLRRLTDNPANDGLATASPDNQHIAFVTNRDGVWSMYVMNVDGSNQQKLFDLNGGYGGGDQEWFQERISWGP